MHISTRASAPPSRIITTPLALPTTHFHPHHPRNHKSIRALSINHIPQPFLPPLHTNARHAHKTSGELQALLFQSMSLHFDFLRRRCHCTVAAFIPRPAPTISASLHAFVVQPDSADFLPSPTPPISLWMCTLTPPSLRVLACHLRPKLWRTPPTPLSTLLLHTLLQPPSPIVSHAFPPSSCFPPYDGLRRLGATSSSPSRLLLCLLSPPGFWLSLRLPPLDALRRSLSALDSFPSPPLPPSSLLCARDLPVNSSPFPAWLSPSCLRPSWCCALLPSWPPSIDLPLCDPASSVEPDPDAPGSRDLSIPASNSLSRSSVNADPWITCGEDLREGE